MEGHRLEDEASARTAYQPYRPQSFDDPSSVAPAADSGGVEAAGEFSQGFTAEQAHLATFEDRTQAPGEGETDFASLKFQRENTLLTNAESYAASIREEAQLYVRQLRGEVESLNQEAEARYAEAERIKTEAVAEAERIKAEALASLEEVREEARREGFEAGREEGVKQGYEESAPTLERLEQVLQEISQFRRRVAFYTEKDGVRLALLIAKKVLGSELKINKEAVATLVAGTLAKMQGKGAFRVWLAPADYEFVLGARKALERYLDEEQTLTLRAKPELTPGNVLIETDREVIDLTFQSQFYHLEQQLTRAIDERETVTLGPRRSKVAEKEAAAAKAPERAAPKARSAAKPEAPGHGE